MAPEIARIDRRPTESTKAYGLYLRGRYHLNKRGIEDIKKAAEYFAQAVKNDAKIALGHAGLADSHELLAFNYGIGTEANHETAKVEVATALDLDENLAEAHATRGLVLYHDYDFKGAEQEFKKAIELKPSYATGHQWYFHVLVVESRWNEALNQIEKAVELDPFSQIINLNHADYYLSKRLYDKALELTERALELDPNDVTAHFQLMGTYARMKRLEDAKRECKIAVDLLQDAYPQVLKRTEAFIAYFEDDKEGVRRLLPGLEASLGEPLAASATEIAGLYFYLGEVNNGFAWLEQSYSRKEPFLPGITSDESFDNVRTDPRYQNLMKRLGLEPPSSSPART